MSSQTSPGSSPSLLTPPSPREDHNTDETPPLRLLSPSTITAVFHEGFATASTMTAALRDGFATEHDFLAPAESLHLVHLRNLLPPAKPVRLSRRYGRFALDLLANSNLPCSHDTSSAHLLSSNTTLSAPTLILKNRRTSENRRLNERLNVSQIAAPNSLWTLASFVHQPTTTHGRIRTRTGSSFHMMDTVPIS